MKAFRMAVGTKIFAGFIALVCVGAAIGAAGYLSLNRVTDAGDVNQASRDVRAKLLEARILEKDYLIKKDNNSFAVSRRTGLPHRRTPGPHGCQRFGGQHCRSTAGL